jgi:hypothetical protein
MFFSEFTSVSDKVVIMKETLDACSKIVSTRKIPIGPHAGLDLSAGGDEVVFSVWLDNVQVGQETFVSRETEISVREIIDWMGKYAWTGLKDSDVCADDGGVGRGILGHLRDKGYNFNLILFNSRAREHKRYAMRGAELWWNFKVLLEHHVVKLLPDRVLQSQLSNRYYRHQALTNRIVLEKKEEAKAKGHPSPDRADAAVLAWAIMDVDGIITNKIEEKPAAPKVPRYTAQELEDIYYEDSYSLNGISLLRQTRPRDKRMGFSMDSLLKSRGLETKKL